MERVKENKDLQECIDQNFASRFPCFVLMYLLILRVLVFILMLTTTEELLIYAEGHRTFAIPSIFVAYLIIEIVRELQEFFALGAIYLE